MLAENSDGPNYGSRDELISHSLPLISVVTGYSIQLGSVTSRTHAFNLNKFSHVSRRKVSVSSLFDNWMTCNYTIDIYMHTCTAPRHIHSRELYGG